MLFNLLLIKWFAGSFGKRTDIMINSLNYYKLVKHTWWLMLFFIILLVINRLVYFVFMHRLHTSNGVKKMIGPKELPIMYSINIAILVLGFSVYLFEVLRGDFDPFMYIWCFAELVNSFFLIPYYYVTTQEIYNDLLNVNKCIDDDKRAFNPKAWFKKFANMARRGSNKSPSKVIEGFDIKEEDEGRSVSIAISADMFS